jgi:F5/8 type C domain
MHTRMILTTTLILLLIIGLVENTTLLAAAESLDPYRLNIKSTARDPSIKEIHTELTPTDDSTSAIKTSTVGPVHKMRLKQSDAPPILTPEKKYQLEEEVKDDIPRGPPLKLSNNSIQGPNPGSEVQGISIPNQSIIQSNNNNNDFNSRAGPSIQQTNVISNKCQSLTLNAVTSTGDDGSHMPVNAIDHNVSTTWSNSGSGSWIQADLGEMKVVCSVDIIWYRGNLRQNNFVISASTDGSTFRTVYIGKSSGKTLSAERYDFPEIVPRYIRITVDGNTENNYTSITEINVNGYNGFTTTTPQLRSTSLSHLPLQVSINRIVSPASSSRSIVNEPSVANNGKLVFYTGNWYASRSVDGGLTWTYIDPTNDMNDFCCDQDVIYDPHHQIFIWYRQGIETANGQNRFRLGVSADALNWWFYNISPKDFNSQWTNQSWDYPQLALSNKYLYISSNVFKPDGSFLRTVISRWSLDDLGNAATNVSFNYYDDETVFTFTPVQGATDTMYWAAHLSNSRMRIYEWPEILSSNNASVRAFDRDIPAWTTDSRGAMSCNNGPDGKDWCGRADTRILNGWISKDTIGFIWIADKGNGFPWPYLNAADFKISDGGMTYFGRPYLWSSDKAWMYGFVSPNVQGDLAIVASVGGRDLYPSVAVGTNDNSNGSHSPWDMKILINGTNGPSDNRWGDYFRIRPFSGSGLTWAASGYTLQGGSRGDSVEPRYLVFGRQNEVTSLDSPLEKNAINISPTSNEDMNQNGTATDQTGKNSIDVQNKTMITFDATVTANLTNPDTNANGVFGNNNQSFKSQSQSNSSSGSLEGRAYFKGLPCNPKTNIKVPPCDGLYPNYEIVIYTTDGKSIVSKTKTDKNGNYTMLLTPGNYVIYTKAGISSSGLNTRTNNFMVEVGKTTKLILLIDTGIR